MTQVVLTEDYLWIVVVAAFAALTAAFGIGANDVANSLATAVGAKSITIRQAVILSTIFEFLGAVFFGTHVTKTIRKGIADQTCFEDNPALLMYGMMCVLFAVAIWLFLATYYEMPVSTTHSCVGGIVGMTIVAVGKGCVTWYEEKDDFPFIGGVAGIVVSWITAPLFSMVFAGLLFLAVRSLVLRHENSYERSYKFYPLVIWLTMSVCAMFVIFKAGKGRGLGDKLSEDESKQDLYGILFSLVFGLIIALVSIPTLLPWIRKRINKEWDSRAATELESGVVKKPSQDGLVKPVKNDTVEHSPNYRTGLTSIQKYVSQSLDTDPHACLATDKRVKEIHDNAEVFDEKTEWFFRYVQVFTCCCDSFAHGANDVANSIGPFAAVYMIYKAGEVEKKNELGTDAYWILAIGGVGICIGLTLYGYKIMQVLGTKIMKVTPSRGFAVELGAVAVIIMGTRLGIPLSTTHCQVGASCGVALAEGRKGEGVNFFVLGKVIAGWVLTLVVAGATAGLFTALGAYAPTAYGPAYSGMTVV